MVAEEVLTAWRLGLRNDMVVCKPEDLSQEQTYLIFGKRFTRRIMNDRRQGTSESWVGLGSLFNLVKDVWHTGQADKKFGDIQDIGRISRRKVVHIICLA